MHPATQPHLKQSSTPCSSDDTEGPPHAFPGRHQDSSRPVPRDEPPSNSERPHLQSAVEVVNTLSLQASLDAHRARPLRQQPRFHFIVRQHSRHGLAFGDREAFMGASRPTPLDPPTVCQLVTDRPEYEYLLAVPAIALRAQLCDSAGNVIRETPRGNLALWGEVDQGGFVASVFPPSTQSFFIFSELAVRLEGTFRLRFDIIDHSLSTFAFLGSLYSDAFTVHGKMTFPGLCPSTELTRAIIDKGLKLRLIKAPGQRTQTEGKKKRRTNAAFPDARESEDEAGMYMHPTLIFPRRDSIKSSSSSNTFDDLLEGEGRPSSSSASMNAPFALPPPPSFGSDKVAYPLDRTHATPTHPSSHVQEFPPVAITPTPRPARPPLSRSSSSSSGLPPVSEHKVQVSPYTPALPPPPYTGQASLSSVSSQQRRDVEPQPLPMAPPGETTPIRAPRDHMLMRHVSTPHFGQQAASSGSGSGSGGGSSGGRYPLRAASGPGPGPSIAETLVASPPRVHQAQSSPRSREHPILRGGPRTPDLTRAVAPSPSHTALPPPPRPSLPPIAHLFEAADRPAVGSRSVTRPSRRASLADDPHGSRVSSRDGERRTEDEGKDAERQARP